MTTLQPFIRRKTVLTFTTCLALGFATSYAFAGFEWIPPSQKKAAEKPTMQPAPVPSAAEVVDDSLFLPLPSDAELVEPAMEKPKAAMGNMAPEPVVIIEDAPTMKTAAPTRITVMPKETPNSGVIVQQAEEPILPPLEIANDAPVVIESNDPEMLKKPPFTVTNTRIIMPEDAPATAIEQTKKNNIAIAPFPSDNALIETQEPPVVFDNRRKSVEDVLNEDDETAPQYADAVGFAKNVPLAIALQQIVPAGYAYSFGTNVNPGVRVSWNGGKAWNDVVSDMVAPLGYNAVIRGNVIRIGQPSSDEILAPTVPVPYTLEPAAGTEDKLDASKAEAPVERERKIKRINIMDPGADNVQEPTLIQKVTSIFEAKDQEIETALETPEAIIEAAAPSTKISFWTAEKGASLKDTLTQWSEAANAELVWDAAQDLQLSSDFEVQGSFEKAVELLLKHGTGSDQAAFEHSYVATSESNKVKIIVGSKA